MQTKNNLINFVPCFYASFFIGMVALEIGVLLPYLMYELSLSYTMAGGILSAFAIGNLLASLINSILIKRFGSKLIVTFFSSLICISFLMMALLPSYHLLYFIVLSIGVGRGIINIYIYSSANGKVEDTPIYVHWLSIIFAIGALGAPIMTSLLMYCGLGWRQVVYVFFSLSVMVPVLLATRKSAVSEKMKQNTSINISDNELGKIQTNNFYLRNPGFYIIGFTLFCYIGLENCVNGWFIQYFKDMNIMSNEYANTLVSITWMFVIIGRLVSAYFSTKFERRKIILINCIGAAIFFVLLIATRQLGVITVSIVGLGFFCAGIYPTCISSSKQILNGSASGMSWLLALASLGGIITPQIVGILADRLGLVTAIIYVIIVMLLMVAFAVINYFKRFSED